VICPACKQYNDPALSVSGRIPPKDWDPCVCVNCGTLSCIDHTVGGDLRPPVDDDLDAWQADAHLWRVIEQTRTAVRRMTEGS
jgi:hypothetical protein